LPSSLVWFYLWIGEEVGLILTDERRAGLNMAETLTVEFGARLLDVITSSLLKYKWLDITFCIYIHAFNSLRITRPTLWQ
jgi:hypothetical protein